MKVFPGKEICCVYDHLGPVRVYDDGNKRYLTFGSGDEQSCTIKANPSLLQYDYNRMMLLVLLLCQPKNITIVGLGGGNLPSCLLHHLPEAVITVVELRPVVIELASKYFDLPESERLTVIQGDALDYLAQTPPGQCDLLFSDLYMAGQLDTRQLTRQFMDNAFNLLTDDGWLVINCLSQYRSDIQIHEWLDDVFTSVFEGITEDGNWVIIAGKSVFDEAPKALFNQAKQWSKRLGFSLLPQLKRLFYRNQ